MSRKTPLFPLLTGMLTWVLLASPSGALPGGTTLLDSFDPMDPEVLVSIKAVPPDRPDVMALHAEYWVSRPELVLVTFTTEGGMRWPASGVQSPPLRIDGATLAPRSCHALRASAESPSRFQVPMTMDEFTRMVRARNVEWVQDETRIRLGTEQRAPLQTLWDRLRPMVNDPAFRAHALLREGSTEAITTLLRGGWDANRPTYVGRPPLGVVAAQGNLDGVNVLLKAGAKLDGADAQGRTALQHAILQGHTDLAMELLDRGASLSQADRQGRTPLHLALSERNALLVQTLLERGASPHASDQRGMNALHLAVELAAEPADSTASRLVGIVDPAVRQSMVTAEPLELVRTLLRFRADPRLPVATPSGASRSDEVGLNAIDLALRQDADAVVTELMGSPLVSASDLPSLWNDLGEVDPALALSRLQTRLRRLSPARLFGDYATRSFQEQVERDHPAGTAEQRAARERVLRALRLALDPRRATIQLELPPLEPGADPALSFALTEQSFLLTHPLSDDATRQDVATSRLVLAKEGGVWKISRFEGAGAPREAAKNRLTETIPIE